MSFNFSSNLRLYKNKINPRKTLRKPCHEMLKLTSFFYRDVGVDNIASYLGGLLWLLSRLLLEHLKITNWNSEVNS